MTNSATVKSAAPEPDGLKALRAKLPGTNINEKSLLATDYLNHFNEVVMLFDLIVDMPECFEDATAWRPKSYQDHFRDSGISDRELAIEAYELAPADFREMFDQTVDHMNKLVATRLAQIATALESGDADSLHIATKRASRDLMRLNDLASTVINGAMPTISQDEIDDLLAE